MLSLGCSPVLWATCWRRRQAQQSRPDRKRAVGGGRKRRLAPYQEVLMTLTYLRHNVSHEVVGGLFGVSTATSENTFHEVVPLTRSPKGGELTPAQREANRQLAQQRIYVEHGIRRVKGGRILRDDYRLAVGLFATVAHAVVGLVQRGRILG